MSLSFLHELYTAYPQDAGLLCEIRCLPPARDPNVLPLIRFFGMTHLNKAAEFAASQKSERDVYMGVLPRAERPGPGLGGLDKHVNDAGWLWCDIDRGEASDAAMLDFLKGVRAQLPKPRIIVFSGSGGAHLYWQLASPIYLALEGRDEFQQMLRRLVQKVGAGPDGIHADRSCCNLSRILRLPYTANHKHNPPQRVQGVICDAHDALTATQWDELLPWEAQPVKKTLTRVKFATTNGYQNRIPPKLMAWAQAGYPEGKRHHDIVGAAAWLRRDTDLPDNVALELLRLKAQNSPGSRPLTDDEVEKAWQWAA